MRVVHPGQRGEAVVATPSNCSPEEPRMNVHKNARLTPKGRALLVSRVRTERWPVAKAAARRRDLPTNRVSLAGTASGGRRACPTGPELGARPMPTPHRRRCHRLSIEQLRRQRMTGPQIAQQLGIPRSTVGAMLRRLGLGRLSALEPKPESVRYERDKPGELIHIDIKKLGRIDGIGHRITGDRTGQSNKRGTGWEYLHVAIDDASRLAYTEILPNERKETAIAFTRRALTWFQRFGVTTERLMTDNGSAYKSHAYRDLMPELGIRHKRTRPYTPRTNGKAERFIQTSLREWAYATAYHSSAERTEALQPWLTTYNSNRNHSALGGQPPFKWLTNLPGFDMLGSLSSFTIRCFELVQAGAKCGCCTTHHCLDLSYDTFCFVPAIALDGIGQAVKCFTQPDGAKRARHPAQVMAGPGDAALSHRGSRSRRRPQRILASIRNSSRQTLVRSSLKSSSTLCRNSSDISRELSGSTGEPLSSSGAGVSWGSLLLLQWQSSCAGCG